MTTYGIAGPYGNVEDGILKGARRSRLSFHMRTRGVRRWLLVQLVSVPVTADIEDEEYGSTSTHLQANNKPPNMGQLVDEYRTRQSMRAWT